MTRYSRSVIPGRAQPEDRPLSELDRAIFGGPNEGAGSPAAARSVKAGGDPVLDADAPPERLFAERTPGRRKAPRRKQDFSPLPPDDGLRAAENGVRGPLILAGTLVVIVVFGAVVWNAYSKGLRAPDGGATPELAAAGPFKSRPAIEPAKASSDVDASVFDRVEGAKKPALTATTANEERETTKPAPAAALAPPPAAVVANPATTSPSGVQAAVAPSAPPSAKTVKAAAAETGVRPTTPSEAGPVNPPLAKPASAAKADPVKPQAAKAASIKTAAPPKEPAPSAISRPEAAGAFKPAFSPNGAYVVQLAAPSSEAAALAEWEKRVKAAPAVMHAAERLIQRADVNGKTVYRLRAGSFAAPADADAFCSAVKASGGACFRAMK